MAMAKYASGGQAGDPAQPSGFNTFMSNGSFAQAASGSAGIIDGLDQGTPYGRKRVGTSVATGALSGAATGAAIGGPWGALIGGVVGGAAGWIGGSAAKKKENKMINGMAMQRDSQLRQASAAKIAADPGQTAGYGTRGYYARGGSLRKVKPEGAGYDTTGELAQYITDTNPWLMEGQMQSDALDGRLQLAYGGPLTGGPGPVPIDTANVAGAQMSGKTFRAKAGTKIVDAKKLPQYEQVRAQNLDSLSRAWGVPSTEIVTQSQWPYGKTAASGGVPNMTSYEYAGGQPNARRMLDYYEQTTRGTDAYTHPQDMLPNAVQRPVNNVMTKRANGGRITSYMGKR